MTAPVELIKQLGFGVDFQVLVAAGELAKQIILVCNNDIGVSVHDASYDAVTTPSISNKEDELLDARHLLIS